MVRINGKELPVDGSTLADYLAGAGYDTQRLAVERNGEIVQKEAYAQTVLTDGDSIEIVRFVGGG